MAEKKGFTDTELKKFKQNSISPIAHAFIERLEAAEAIVVYSNLPCEADCDRGKTASGECTCKSGKLWKRWLESKGLKRV